jgi:hypothetical protein
MKLALILLLAFIPPSVDASPLCPQSSFDQDDRPYRECVQREQQRQIDTLRREIREFEAETRFRSYFPSLR